MEDVQYNYRLHHQKFSYSNTTPLPLITSCKMIEHNSYGCKDDNANEIAQYERDLRTNSSAMVRG